MLESIHGWFVTLADEYSLVLLCLILLIANWPVFVAVRFKIPDERKELPIAIKKKAIQIFNSSLPVGFIWGISLLNSSKSIRDLILIPLGMIGFSLAAAIVVSLGILRLSQRHYNQEN